METKKNSQNEANKRWQAQNKEHSRYLKDRSAARSFIRNKSTADDLEELLNLITERKKQLDS